MHFNVTKLLFTKCHIVSAASSKPRIMQEQQHPCRSLQWPSTVLFISGLISSKRQHIDSSTGNTPTAINIMFQWHLILFQSPHTWFQYLCYWFSVQKTQSHKLELTYLNDCWIMNTFWSAPPAQAGHHILNSNKPSVVHIIHLTFRT